jgi:exodeoxyribonuclease VII small subunit
MAAPDVTKLSFEDAMAELDKIVRALESGGGDLKSSIAAFERGQQLRAQCEALLKDAEKRIEKIIVDDQGQVKAENFSLPQN